MDLLKEIADLKDAIRKAVKDGKVTLPEIIRIAKELVDVLVILFPIIIESKQKEGDKQ